MSVPFAKDAFVSFVNGQSGTPVPTILAIPRLIEVTFGLFCFLRTVETPVPTVCVSCGVRGRSSSVPLSFFCAKLSEFSFFEKTDSHSRAKE